MVKFTDRLKDGLYQGFGIGLGLLIIFVLVIGVYAFVEPTKGPSNNYVVDWLSPLNIMRNDTNQKVTAIQKTTTGLTLNSGMYDNRIPEGSYPYAYTEICFKGGNILNDQHSGGQSTAGGNCLPGDVGFIIEQNDRSEFRVWTIAKENCLRDGMRLPEPFEYQVAAFNSSDFGITYGRKEWISNSVFPDSFGNLVSGVTFKGYSGWDTVENQSGDSISSAYYRCAK